VCLCGLLLLLQGTGRWSAHADEGQSAAARLLHAPVSNASAQRPSAFRKLLMQQAAPPAAAPAGQPMRLFNTVEFKGPLKSLPQWTRILGVMGNKRNALSASLPAKPRAAWEAFRDSVQGAPLMEQLQKVNAYINKYPYRLDQELWNKNDYWASPPEFASKSGDCEDYSITKYYALKELGVPAADMRIVAVRDRIRGIGHAVLVVFAAGTAYVLDNQTNLVLPHDRYGHYLPQYSVNEFNRWAHVPVK